MTILDEERRTRADELLRAAHEGGYRYEPSFAGFRAEIELVTDERAARGSVVLRPGREPELDIELPPDDERWLRHELGSLAAHRWHRSYADADGPTSKSVDDDGHPLGPLVELDDALESSYRISDGRISAITRTHGSSRFTIVIQERAEAPDGRVVSTAFTVFFSDADSGRLVRAAAYTDDYVEVEGRLLPRLRRIATSTDDGLRVRQIELSQHELLELVEEGR